MNRDRWRHAPWVAASVAAACAAMPAQAADAGLQVTRDAETGALRAPTAAEAAALRGKAGSGTASRVVMRKLANGAVVADVPESLMSYTVLTRHADGALTRRCVQGAEQAAQASERPSFTKPLSMATARTARGMAYEER